MKVPGSALLQSRDAGSTASVQFDKAAQTLMTLVQSCYPSASVVFPHTLASITSNGHTRGVSGHLEALPSPLQARLASRGGIATEAVEADRLHARRTWGPPTSASSAARRPWWEVMAHVSASKPLSAFHRPNPFGLSFTPDAVVFIDGVEATDVASVVAPTIIAAVPAVVSLENVGGDRNTHGGERLEPIYCRRKTDWARLWQEKQCALRGADLLELSLPIAPHHSLSSSASATTAATCDASPARVSLLVTVANPSISIATLHRQSTSQRRGSLRTTFGYSLPCLQAALPDAVVQCVRLLRAWQQQHGPRESGPAQCTSAFWVSAVGHLLSPDGQNNLHDPIDFVLEEWLRDPEKMSLTCAETELLHSLRQAAASPAEDLACVTVSDNGDILPLLLFSAVAHVVASHDSHGEWNSTNFFLPPEHFKETTDFATATALSRSGCCSLPLSRSALEELRHRTRP